MYLDPATRTLVYSPSDLTTFMGSPYASWMDRLRHACPQQAPAPDATDPLSGALARKGLVHEAEQLQRFKQQGKRVVELPGVHTGNADILQGARELTRQAMQEGVDVIFQALLEKPPFRGLADFLVRVSGASELGDYHYEVWDTKLSSSAKPSHLLQLCCYADMLQAMQGVRPEQVVVALGSGSFSRFRTDDYFYYYRALKAGFLNAQQVFKPETPPDPADYADHGRWSAHAQQQLQQVDHLGTIANITRSQIKKLNKAGIHTRASLAASGAASVPGMQPEIFQRLRAQAALQLRSEGLDKPLFELLPPQHDRPDIGLSALPAHSPLDVFFDIEGYPLEHGGLEYLWGCTYYNEAGERCFRDFWAHDAVQEKQAFTAFIDWVYGRWQRDPAMHIYHYANYEIAACRKLMGRYGVREHEVDQLLRNGVFVDLYQVVKGSLRVGEPRYSIKNIEHLYRPRRDTDVASGGDSMVAYEAWRERVKAGEEGDTWETSAILRNLRDYNRDDCDSTEELVGWLRQQQLAAGIVHGAPEQVIEPELNPEITERLRLRDALLQRAEQESAGEQTRGQGRITENLA